MGCFPAPTRLKDAGSVRSGQLRLSTSASPRSAFRHQWSPRTRRGAVSLQLRLRRTARHTFSTRPLASRTTAKGPRRPAQRSLSPSRLRRREDCGSTALSAAHASLSFLRTASCDLRLSRLHPAAPFRRRSHRSQRLWTSSAAPSARRGCGGGGWGGGGGGGGERGGAVNARSAFLSPDALGQGYSPVPQVERGGPPLEVSAYWKRRPGALRAPPEELSTRGTAYCRATARRCASAMTAAIGPSAEPFASRPCTTLP